MKKIYLILILLFVPLIAQAQGWTAIQAKKILLAADSGKVIDANFLTIYLDTNHHAPFSWTISSQQGDSGTFLQNDGAGHLSWQPVSSGGGTVTSISGSGGTTGLTLTGGPITTSGTLTLGGTLIIANGGTGKTTRAAAFNALVPDSTSGTGNFLRVTPGGGYDWSSAGVGTVTSVDVSGGSTGLSFTGGPITTSGTITAGGTLGVQYGGTGAGTWNSDGILYGQGTSTLGVTSAGSNGQVLTSHGGSSAPDFEDVPAPLEAVITDPGSSVRNLITPTHDTIVPITLNIAGTSSKHITNWDVDSASVAYIAPDGSFSTNNNVTAGQEISSVAGNVGIKGGTLTFPGIGIPTWNLPDSSGTIALLQNIPDVAGLDTTFLYRWPVADSQNTITTIDTTIVPLTIVHAPSSTGYYQRWYNGATEVAELSANSGTTADLTIHGIISTSGSGVNADINSNHDINAAHNLSADSSLLLAGAYGTGTLTLSGLTTDRTWLLPDVSGTLVPLNSLSLGNNGVVLYNGTNYTSSSGTTSGYVLTSNGTGTLPTWQAGPSGASFILNQYTAQTSAGFNIGAGAPAKTGNFAEATISNDATSSTSSIDKYGLLVSSTGTWNGSGAVNDGIAITTSGGTSNYDINGTSGNWSVTNGGAGLFQSLQLTTPLAISYGGTGQSTRAAALNALVPDTTSNTDKYLHVTPGGGIGWSSVSGGFTNPMTTLGDMIYENATPAPARLAGQTTMARAFLAQTESGGTAAAPAWFDLFGTANTWTGTQAFHSSASFGSNGGTSGEVALYGGTSGAIVILAPAAPTTYTFTLPSSGGTSGYLLETNGSGGTSWTPAGAGTVTSISGSGGTTGLTLTGGPITTSGTLTLGGTLVVANGGTGAATLTGILQGNGTSAVSAISLPADATKYLDGTGAFSVPVGGGSGITVYSVTTADANNTASLVHLLSISVPGGTWADGQTIEFAFIIDAKQNSGGSINVTLGGTWNSNAVSTSGTTAISSGVAEGVSIRHIFITRVGTSIYFALGSNFNGMLTNSAGTVNIASNFYTTAANGVILTGQSFSSTATLTIDFTWASANASTFYKIISAEAWKI